MGIVPHIHSKVLSLVIYNRIFMVCISTVHDSFSEIVVQAHNVRKKASMYI